MRKHLVILLSMATLSACSLTPELVMPDTPVPKLYPLSGGEDGQVKKVYSDWSEIFLDPRLQQLIKHALVNNRDLKLATLNVAAVQAQYGIQRSASFPSVDATVSLTRQRSNTNGGGATVSSLKNIGIGTSAFEVDLFSRASTMTDAAFDRFIASEQGRNAAEISLISAVADAYHAQLLAKEQWQLARKTLIDWQQSLALVRQLKDANQSSGLDVAQAEGQVASAEADVEARSRALLQANNNLQLLTGGDVPEQMVPVPLLETLPRPVLQVGLPSALLTRRPDVLQAEHNLRAANADIGAARAAFFPRISLTTTFGYGSAEMKNLFSSDSRSWTFVPQLSLPIFTAGKLRAELRLAEVRKSIAVAEYERAIQIAFREVADGLAGRETYGRQIEAQQRAVASAEKRLNLSNLRYRAGMEGRLELLDSQRQLYGARQVLIDLRAAEMSNFVALYKALGGNFSS